MKKVQNRSFKLKPIAASIVFAMAAQMTANVAYGNAGYGVNVNISGATIAVPTYYANSPQGVQPALDPTTHLPCTDPAANATTCATAGTIDTGTALRKFVDPLAGAYFGVDGLPSAGISMGLPIGVTDQWVDASGNAINGNTDDYYEIAAVEYTEQMHSDLPKQTRLRGYVQIETPNMVAKGLKDITGVIGSEHIPGTYPDGTPIYRWKKDPVTGVWAQSTEQVYFVHAPHYLGPTLLAKHGQPIRILFHNYLPYRDINGVSHGSDRGLGGDLTIPTDEILAGGGPVVNADGTPMLDTHVGSPNFGKPIKFSQNRIAVHWHGGDSPWTNDGTPHEWYAPAGDASYSYTDATHPNGLGVGDAYNNVPDMPDPGPGSQTMYFPNNLSGRLMMYHDHASGITRLNAYYGEAAGYLVYDPTELTLAATALGTTLGATSTITLPSGATATIPSGTLDAVGIPLVIQDKVFVPKNIGAAATTSDGVTIQSQDTKWDLTHWGQPGDLFFPHVYETNQDPNSIDGTNPVGRWDWGPWFWPVFPSQYSLPSGVYGDVTTTPEAFVDTPIVNGQAYPTLTVDPKTYRFRILGIGNDRSWNLGLYQAVDANGVICSSAAAPALAYPLTGNADAAHGQTKAVAACTEIAMVPASQPSATALSTATGLPLAPAWPVNYPLDGRAGGVPDPTTIGPDIVQIGNEAGLLPAPAIWPAQPVTYDQNVRSMTVYNVLHHQLLLGAGERADILVDFSKFAGKTVILYNDAPAPMPGFDSRIDYFTGVGDQTVGGGAYNTMPGYGPNTRTIMQFKVNATNTSNVGGALNVANLSAALPVAYAATQPAPIVPESAYNTVFNTTNGDNYARIFTGSTTSPDFEWTNPAVVNLGTIDTVSTSPTYNKILPGSGINVVSGGAGYTSAPTVTINGPLVPGRGGVASNAQATATVTNGVVTGITVTNLGTGYDATQLATTPLTVTLTGGTPTTAATLSLATNNHQSVHVINKAIQELFDPIYGRMNATLAVELPFSSATVATTIPLAYIDAPQDDPVNVLNNMDGIDDGETQVWKITHNGVDSHPVHFHLVNVQVINRVDWAGVVKPPEANEIGWKETLRMNPLEDVYVAVKAVRPVIPFGVPRSQRVLDPSQAVGSQLGFTQIDQLTGNAPTYQNQITAASPQIVSAAPGLPPVAVWNLPVTLTTGLYSNVLTDFDNEYVWHCHILGHEENDFMRPFVFHPAMATPDAPGAVTVNGSTITWTDPTPFNGQDAQGIPTAGLNATGAKVSSPKNEIGFKVLNAAGTVIASVPANTTSWTDTTGLLSLTGATVVAYNSAGTSALGTSAASGGSSINSGAASGAIAAGNTTTALTNAATAGVTAATTTAAATAATATATATANSAANAALAASTAAAGAPVAFALGTPAVTISGAIPLVWANNPANVVPATGYTNVTGYTLSWAGNPAGTTTLPVTAHGVTIEGLTTRNSYTFTLNAIAPAPAANSATVTITGIAP